jgi:hypothetical protein
MDNGDILHRICFNDKHINALIEVIRGEIKISERSIPKCASMVADVMKKNISRLNRQPKNKEELKKIVEYLDKMCVNSIIEIIVKKYPDAYINRKTQVSKEQMRRDLDVWGDRGNHVQDRPHTRTRREYDDDETFYSMRPNDTGFAGHEDTGGYASAFSNPMITNVPLGQKQPAFNNPHSQRDGGFEQRYQQMMNERNYGMGGPQKPPTPDFTLDGSGEKVRMEKMKRQMETNQMGMGAMGGMGSMGGLFDNGMSGLGGTYGMGTGTMEGAAPMMGGGGFDMSDPYASLLGSGAPGVQGQGQGQQIPFMGMGNPMMPMSSTNIMADQYGYTGQGNVSAKQMQLNNDYERKMMERRMTDVETGQPQGSSSQNNYGNQGGGYQMPPLGNYPMGGNNYQMPQMPMQMPQMPMSQMQMPQMSMPMQMPMQMPQMQMPMQMPMQLPQMPMNTYA